MKGKATKIHCPLTVTGNYNTNRYKGKLLGIQVGCMRFKVQYNHLFTKEQTVQTSSF